MSTENDPSVSGGAREIVRFMNEGQRLRDLLTRYEKGPSDLADAVGVSRAMGSKYCKMEQFSPKSWRNVRDGLRKLGIDPSLLRPDDVKREARQEEDLRPLVDRFDRQTLTTIKYILEADTVSQGKLLYYVDGLLKPR